MPTYVVLVNWTEQGIKNVKETIERTDEGTELAKKHGTEFKQAFWTVGPYDMVAIFESPDDETLSAHLLEICASGSVKTMTMRAYDREEMSGILQRLA
jgi:uncharacterized protein with GYD domain